MSPAVLFALCLLGLGAFTNSLGLILMKVCILQNGEGGNYITKPKYIAGLGCLLFGGLVLVGNH